MDKWKDLVTDFDKELRSKGRGWQLPDIITVCFAGLVSALEHSTNEIKREIAAIPTKILVTHVGSEHVHIPSDSSICASCKLRPSMMTSEYCQRCWQRLRVTHAKCVQCGNILPTFQVSQYCSNCQRFQYLDDSIMRELGELRAMRARADSILESNEPYHMTPNTAYWIRHGHRKQL